MPDCTACSLFQLESDGDTCLHVNRPGGLELTRKAMDLCNLPANTSVLDVASGAGSTLKYLNDEKGFRAFGLDLSLKMLKYGQIHHPGLRLIQGDCEKIPLPAGSQHALLTECAFSLTGGSDHALREFHRVLRPDGLLIVTDVYIREVLDPQGLDCLSATTCLTGAVTEETIRRKISNNGFRITTWQDHTFLFKQWLTHMIFKLGSLEAFYRQLVHCEKDAESMSKGLGSQIKLGYYLMIAQKEG